MKKIFCNMLSVIKKSPPAFILAMVALLGVLALSGSVQAVEVDASLYQVLYGDIDGDGNKDIYLAPKPEYTPEPGGNGFKLLAQASGYTDPQLDNNVDTTGFTSGDFQLIAGDFNGDGVVDVLVQSTRQSLLSFTLANNLVESVPHILQTFASLGSDTHSIVVNDINNDGRDDITYTTNDQSQNLYASNQGHLQSTSQAQVTAHYGYDYLNKRRYKVVEEIGENREGVLYIDDNTELRDGQLQKYITLGAQKVARSAQGGGEFSPSEFYLNNHLGSVALTLDDSAQVKNAFTYQPFGGKQIAYGNTELSPYGFTGKEQDPETQLGYFHHRYLNTQVGQFITPDPVFAMNDRFTDPQLWSPYAYGRNNPILYTDPNGGSPISVLAKQMAKKGAKDGMQNYGEKRVFKRIKRYMTDKNRGKFSKEFKEDLKGVMDSFDQEWYETAFEFIPVAGDVYGAGKFAVQLKKAHDKLQDLENKWVEKIYKTLDGKERDKFVQNMRRLGVMDKRKDSGIKNNSGLEGHHEKSVLLNKDKMTDPRNVDMKTKEAHKLWHQENGYK